jgi:hypothetical protein
MKIHRRPDSRTGERGAAALRGFPHRSRQSHVAFAFSVLVRNITRSVAASISFEYFDAALFHHGGQMLSENTHPYHVDLKHIDIARTGGEELLEQSKALGG